MFINNDTSSVIIFLFNLESLYNDFKSKHCGVCVNNKLFLSKLYKLLLILYLIESFGLIIGTTALLLLSLLINFFRRFIEKSGLAASWIKTLFGLNFLIYFKAIREESERSFPPLIIITFFGNFFLICFLLLMT